MFFLVCSFAICNHVLFAYEIKARWHVWLRRVRTSLFLYLFCWFSGGLHLNDFIVRMPLSPNSLNCRALRAICHSAQSSRQIALCAHPRHITHNDRRKIRLAWKAINMQAAQASLKGDINPLLAKFSDNSDSFLITKYYKDIWNLPTHKSKKNIIDA